MAKHRSHIVRPKLAENEKLDTDKLCMTSIKGLELAIDLHRVRMQLYPIDLTWTREALELAQTVIRLERLLSFLKKGSQQVIHVEHESYKH